MKEDWKSIKTQEQDNLEQIQSLKSENDTLHKQLNSIKDKEKSDMAAENRLLRAHLDEAREESRHIRQEMEDTLKKEVDHIKTAYNRARSPPTEKSQLSDPILNAVERQLDRVSRHVSSNIQDPSFFNVWKEEMDRLRHDILHNLRKKLDERKTLQSQREELDHNHKTILGLQQELEELNHENSRLEEKLTENKITAEDNNELIRELKRQVTKLDHANSMLLEANNAAMKRIDQNNNDFEKHIASLEEKLTSQQARERSKARELEEAQSAQRSANERVQLFEEKLEKKTRLLEREQQKNKQLEEVIAHLRNFSGRMPARMSDKWRGKLFLLMYSIVKYLYI
jgi:DNA repair exonuclease SbcCD ATPase subunit